MSRLFQYGVVVSCLFVALSVQAQAREVVVSPVSPEITQPLGPLTPQASCAVGNTNPAYWAIGGYVGAPEEYALVFEVDGSTCAACPYGFQVSSVHVLLQSGAAMTIVMSVGMSSATITDDPTCAEPGPEECLGGPYQVNLPSAGLWNISLPVDCACASPDYPYALTVRFDSISGGTPDLVTDNFPSSCVSWNDFGNGWVDLVSNVGFPGNLKIWADADCCESPVETIQESMGELKERYQQ